MRSLLVLTILLATPCLAAERTWTIARDVYTTEAELIAVRGDLVYLKIDGKVEEIPIERLSAIDQQFVATLSLAPISRNAGAVLPGPMPDWEIEAAEEMPLPGEADAPASELSLNAPQLAPANGSAPIRSQPVPRAAYRVDQYGRVIPPQPGVAANYLAPGSEPRAGANPNDRRYRQPPQQGPNNQAANAQRNDNDDERPGLFGARARRIERQRAAAARSR